jgi:NAD(P)-dependent dehydrogenase (short-subunit alcohol dehydrogenase family)
VKEFSGRVAVVTGAASGIGRAIAERCAFEGMQVVLADVEQGALDRAVNELQSHGRDAIGVLTDVSKAGSVEALERQARERYGKVHLLFNNAGVLGGRPGAIWESTLNDWQWILGVNVWGVIHGLHTFTPGMLEHGEHGWIVNTASMGGLVPGLSPYGVSKHAVVAISEALYSHLKVREAKIGCSVLCPIFIKTHITSAARNRPAELMDPEVPATTAIRPSRFAGRLENGQPPSEMADAVFDAIRAEQFYVWPGNEVDGVVRTRFNHILARTNPDPRPFG